MDTRHTSLIFAWLLCWQGAQAQIYRCEDGVGNTIYQQWPCADASRSQIVETDSIPEDQILRAQENLERNLLYLNTLEAQREQARQRAADEAFRERQLALERRRIEAEERQAEELERLNTTPPVQIFIPVRPYRPHRPPWTRPQPRPGKDTGLGLTDYPRPSK